MGKFFAPNYYFDHINSIPEDFFSSRGITGVICDIDNTLITYDDAHPTEDALRFLECLRRQRVKVVLASNNNRRRVETFNSTLGLPAFFSSTKPLSRRIFKRSMKIMDSTPQTTAVIGDQIFTDVLGTRMSGIKCAILVQPIRPEKHAILRGKRKVEGWFLRGFEND